MSAPSKIAAIRHAVTALHGAADDGADTRRYAEALQEAGASIDALIEAANRAAIASVRGDDNRPGSIRNTDLDDLRSALARLKGGAA